MEIGIVQGSSISPVLFTIYLEDAIKEDPKLSEAAKQGTLLAYADDIAIYVKGTDAV
jgi:hypothetical protein